MNSLRSNSTDFLIVMISNQITNQNKWGRKLLRRKHRLSEEFLQLHLSTKSHAAYDAAQKNIVSLTNLTEIFF
jgi:Mn-dependent DtxR family transcriptional regulator